MYTHIHAHALVNMCILYQCSIIASCYMYFIKMCLVVTRGQFDSGECVCLTEQTESFAIFELKILECSG